MYYGDDSAHAQRLYDYISNLWFMPATPILSNGGQTVDCRFPAFSMKPMTLLEEIVSLWNENVGLASWGGGIGSYWGMSVRSVKSRSNNGKTSGIVPFIRVMDSLTLAISQGSSVAGLRLSTCRLIILKSKNLLKSAARPAVIQTESLELASWCSGF